MDLFISCMHCSIIHDNDSSIYIGGQHGPVVSMLDLWTNGSRCKYAVGLDLYSKGCFIHFTHFPLLAAWLNMTYDVKKAVKSESSIHPSYQYILATYLDKTLLRHAEMFFPSCFFLLWCQGGCYCWSLNQFCRNKAGMLQSFWDCSNSDIEYQYLISPSAIWLSDIFSGLTPQFGLGNILSMNQKLAFS